MDLSLFSTTLSVLTIFVWSLYAVGAAKLVREDVALVWSGHVVDFSLLTINPHQFVAFYDSNRAMTVGHRKLGTSSWKFKALPSTLIWDSHNWIVFALDCEGFLHVSGNMHAKPLVYFRAARPFDVESLEAAPMVGKDEMRITYPIFFTTPTGELIYYDRNGGSGNGNNLFNIYDPGTKTWRRLMDPTLQDGEGERNAYMHLRKDPTGLFHAVWIWRETRDASTNHDLCYARSRDLRRWETANGSALTLPITAKVRSVIVDPIPMRGGAFNTMMDTGFDNLHRPVISYIKYDEKKRTQVYLARFEDSRWIIRKATKWTKRYQLTGTGWLELPLHIGSVRTVPDRPDILLIDLRHGAAIRRTFMLDDASLRILGLAPHSIEPVRAALAAVDRPESRFPGMQVTMPRAPTGFNHQIRAPAGTGALTRLARVGNLHASGIHCSAESVTQAPIWAFAWFVMWSLWATRLALTSLDAHPG